MVVSDSSILIALSVINYLYLLREMFGEVAIPEAVWHEVVLTGQSEPGASEVKNASWITRQAIRNTLLARSLEESIDRGEAEAIVLAIEQESEIIL